MVTRWRTHVLTALELVSIGPAGPAGASKVANIMKAQQDIHKSPTQKLPWIGICESTGVSELPTDALSSMALTLLTSSPGHGTAVTTESARLIHVTAPFIFYMHVSFITSKVP